jgi:xylulokinase
MSKYIAGIDAGTTGTTVMIVDLRGNIIATAYREYPCKYPKISWVEQDLNLIWGKICQASKEAISKAGINSKDILSLGLSSQRATFVAIDKNWNLLHDSIVWSDGRAIEETEWIKRNLGEDYFYRTSGLKLSSFWSYAKFKWVRDKRPDIYDKCWKFVNGQEWILHQLGAEGIFTDPSSITLNGMMDISKLDWSDDLLKAIRVDKEKLPPVKKPMRRVGEISKDAAEKTGFSEGMPICVGGGDHQCAAIGAGVIEEGLSEITIGTGSVMVAHVDKYALNLDQSVYFGGHAIPNKWDMEGIAMSTGGCLRWWRDVYGIQEKEYAEILELDAYSLIDLEARKAPVGCKGYIFFPFFSGQSAPYYHDNARGGSIGLSHFHDRSMMARAIMEGVAFELRMIVEAMEHVLKKPFKSIRLSGGGAKSDLWCQIQADVYGRPVEKLCVSECTTLGAAILGAVGSGIFNNIEEAVENIVHPYCLVEPHQKNKDIYNDLFDCFKQTFVVLRDANIYNKLQKVSKKHWG